MPSYSLRLFGLHEYSEPEWSVCVLCRFANSPETKTLLYRVCCTQLVADPAISKYPKTPFRTVDALVDLLNSQ